MTQIATGEQNRQELARRLGAKLPERSLKKAAKAHSRGDITTFNTAIEHMFETQVSKSEKLLELLPVDDQLEYFRGVMQQYVAPAITCYSDQSLASRVNLYLLGLDLADQAEHERYRSDAEARELVGVSGVAVA